MIKHGQSLISEQNQNNHFFTQVLVKNKVDFYIKKVKSSAQRCRRMINQGQKYKML